MDTSDPMDMNEALAEALGLDKPRCTATSKQTGERCKRRPHPGSTVCVMHGAAAPQVQRTARERLNALVEPAIAALGKVIKRLDGDPNAAGVVIKAAQIVLDRTGYHPTQAMELNGQDGGPIGREDDLIPVHLLSLDLRRKILEEVEAIQRVKGA
jgi:hypothetical protein